MDFEWDKVRERLPVDGYGYRLRVGATAEDQRREMLRNARHLHKRPTYYECGICGSYHPEGYGGDCRNDLYRIPDPNDIHGPDGWDEISMDDAG
jgi:hypothetical protein